MNKHEILAINLSKSNYGMNKEEVLKILNKLSVEEVDKLTYNMYRTAEKCGVEAFDCEELFEWQ